MNIFNWFVKKKNINKSTDIDDKIKSISVEEYNQYLVKQRHNYFLKAVNKVEKIIDKAYLDYCNECKLKGKYINGFFFIRENTYGITAKDIDSFLVEGDLNGKVYIKNYSVKWHHFHWMVPNSLEVDVLTTK